MELLLGSESGSTVILIGEFIILLWKKFYTFMIILFLEPEDTELVRGNNFSATL